MKRETAIPFTIGVAAFKAFAGISEEHGARQQRYVFAPGAVRERAGEYDCHRNERTLLLKDAIRWAGRTHHIDGTPAAPNC
jgi:hypothetical protein